MEKSDCHDTPKAPESSSGWPIVTLDEICSITSGITKGRKQPPEPLREVPYMAVVNVQDGRLNLEAVKTIQASSSEIERYQLLPGDLLLTEGGDPDKLGRGTVWSGEISECIHQNHIFRVRASSSLIDMGLLSRLVASPFGKAYFLSKAKQTTGIASINLSQLRTFPVALPPLNEQRRIAAKLDTTLAAVDTCRQRLDGVEALLRRFRQAVLAAATSGELTREWRDGVDPSYEQLSFRDLVVDSRTGLVRSSQEQHEPLPGLVPYLKMDAIGEAWGCSYQGYKSVQTTDAELATYELQLGDWLFNTRNSLELVGKSCVWEGPAMVVYNNNILRVRFSSSVSPYWIEIFFRSPMGRGLLFGVKSATTSVAAIYQRSLMALPVLVPSIEEQREIIDRVESLFSHTDQLEARLTSARKIVERLTPALLAKAFRGELVPQDPNDEPASELLNRIRAARQAEAAASGPSRRGRRQAAANPVPSLFDAAPVPPDRLANLLRECGALSERALLAASELDPAGFRAQLALERELGAIQATVEDGQVLLEAVG
jgi:type I restriction enzyme S subunit